jgi:hypothetical protein
MSADDVFVDVEDFVVSAGDRHIGEVARVQKTSDRLRDSSHYGAIPEGKERVTWL